MKKWICILLVLVFAFTVITACTPSNGETPKDSTNGDKTDTSGGKSDHQYRMAYVTNAPIDDGGWNTACYAAMLEAAEIYGFETFYTENVAEADYVSTFAEYAGMGVDLIYGPGNEYTDAMLEVAKDYPNSNFLILSGRDATPNLSSLKADNLQSGFLAGVVAGLKTKTNNVGLVGGIEISSSLESVDGYKQGVAYVNPEAEVHVTWAGSFTDAVLGKEIAISMITTYDVDVFFGLASSVDKGVREGAMEFENRYAIAQPGDHLSQAPDMILTSIVTDNVKLMSMAMEAVKAGTFGNEIVSGKVSDGVLFFGEFGTAAKEIEARALEILEDLNNDKIDLVYEFED